MQKLHFFNSRDKKILSQELEEYYGASLHDEYLLFENSQAKIFLLSPAYARLPTQGLRINNMGMYFAKRERDGVRLSIEGAQLLSPTKHVLELQPSDAALWMLGKDIPFSGEPGFYVLRCGKDILGCGMLKNTVLRNMVPKERRLQSVNTSREEIF